MDQQQILAMILSAKTAGKNEDEIVEMLREARDAQNEQDNSVLESPPEPPVIEDNQPIDKQEEENCDVQNQPIDEQEEEIEWIFADDDIEEQSGQVIETTPVSIISQSNEWEIGVDAPITVDTSLKTVVDSPSGLAIVKTSKLAERVVKPQSARKPYNQSPLSILGSFVFLGAVIGVTVYQFFRLHPNPPNMTQEATVESPVVIVSDAPSINPSAPPLPAVIPNPIPLPPTATPVNAALPTDCGAFDGTREAHIEALKTSRNTLGDSFPVVCQAQLDELQFKYAIEKLAAKDGDLQAATTLICEVTDTYFNTDQDPFSRPFFRDWTESNNRFKVWLEKHLAKTNCPAANYLQ